jgi:hypothetical protein
LHNSGPEEWPDPDPEEWEPEPEPEPDPGIRIPYIWEKSLLFSFSVLLIIFFIFREKIPLQKYAEVRKKLAE